MNKYKQGLWLALLACTTQVAAQSTRTIYSDPISLSPYVDDPRAAIVEGIRRFQWIIREEQPGRLVVQLDRQSVQVLNAIDYDRQQIRFTDISAISYDCTSTGSSSSQRNRRKKDEQASDDADEASDQDEQPVRTVPTAKSTQRTCDVPDSQLTRWRINLRRGVLHQLYTLALADAGAKLNPLSVTPRPPTSKNASAIEHAVYEALLLSESPRVSQWATRSIASFAPQNQGLCDQLAEQLFQGRQERRLSDAHIDALAWYAKVLGETHNPRYRNILTEAQQSYTHARVLQSIDFALQSIPNPPQAQATNYLPGTVNVSAQHNAVQIALSNTRYDKNTFSTVQPGASLAAVIAQLGPPDDYSEMAYRISKEARDSQLAFHYRDAGFVTLKNLAGDQRHWAVIAVVREPFPVRTFYKGGNFAAAQALASWRGIALRDYVSLQEDAIESDPALAEVLEQRLHAMPTPLDIYEDRGLANAIKLVFKHNAASSVDQLRNMLAANNGPDVKDALEALIKRPQKNQRQRDSKRDAAQAE